MADDPDDELALLRRRAYSRSGTPEDLRRLAAREARHPIEVPPEPRGSEFALPVTEPAVTEPAVTEPAEPSPAPPARPRRRPVLLAGAAGILLGATLASLGTLLPRGAEPEEAAVDATPTALVIFDREPGERDDPTPLRMTLAHILPSGFTDVELRWLGAVADREIYVARGTAQGVTTICLISAQAASTAASCTEQSDFAVRGLNLGDEVLELRWGPLGTEIWMAERAE